MHLASRVQRDGERDVGDAEDERDAARDYGGALARLEAERALLAVAWVLRRRRRARQRLRLRWHVNTFPFLVTLGPSPRASRAPAQRRTAGRVRREPGLSAHHAMRRGPQRVHARVRSKDGSTSTLSLAPPSEAVRGAGGRAATARGRPRRVPRSLKRLASSDALHGRLAIARRVPDVERHALRPLRISAACSRAFRKRAQIRGLASDDTAPRGSKAAGCPSIKHPTILIEVDAPRAPKPITSTSSMLVHLLHRRL